MTFMGSITLVVLALLYRRIYKFTQINRVILHAGHWSGLPMLLTLSFVCISSVYQLWLTSKRIIQISKNKIREITLVLFERKRSGKSSVLKSDYLDLLD